MTGFNRQFESNVQVAVIRRILASCLELTWDEAILLPLSHTLSINHCLNALMTYHKRVQGLSHDQKVFVYLGIDEVNQLVHYPSTDGKSDVRCLKEIAEAIQSISPRYGFVSTLLVGTHFTDMTASFLGSGIKPLRLELTRLTEEAIHSMLLTDACVSPQYLSNPHFQELLQGIGPVMRAIGIAVSELEYEYDPASILRARDAVKEYLQLNGSVLTAHEAVALVGLVVAGLPVDATDSVCAGSSLTLDRLQNYGIVHLFGRSDLVGKCSVFMARIIFDNLITLGKAQGPLTTAARRLLAYLDANGPESFQKFIAHYHGVKRGVLMQHVGPSIALSSFFAGALTGPQLERVELQLRPTMVSLDRPEGVLWLKGHRYPDTAEADSVADHLAQGGVILNSKGAAADALVCEHVRDFDGAAWERCIMVYAVKHTIGDAKLTYADVAADRDKAVAVLSASKNHAHDVAIYVHFSNRELSAELTDADTWTRSDLQRSVVVGRGNIENVVGPMFGRILTSKGFYVGIGTKTKSFSTLVQPPRLSTKSIRPRSIQWLRRLW